MLIRQCKGFRLAYANFKFAASTMSALMLALCKCTASNPRQVVKFVDFSNSFHKIAPGDLENGEVDNAVEIMISR